MSVLMKNDKTIAGLAVSNPIIEETSGSGTSGASFSAKRVGNLVTVWLTATQTITRGQDVIFGYLPVRFRPPISVVCTINNASGNLDNDSLSAGVITSNGEIRGYSYTELYTGTTLATVTYIVE